MNSSYKPCFRCGGSGKYLSYSGACFRCQGSGEEPQRKTPLSKPKFVSARTGQSIEDILGNEAKEDWAHFDSNAPPPQIHQSKISWLAQALEAEKRAHAQAISALERADARIEELVRDQAKIFKIKLDSLDRGMDDLQREVNATKKVEITLKGPDSCRILDQYQHYHPKFETLLRIASSRDSSGFTPNIWIAGPSGSGKTTAARQVAQALSLPFFFNGAVSMEHKLLGFTDAQGVYHDTPFRRAYGEPGVYLFDDVDSSENSAILAFNAALANGECDFPDALIQRHSDAIIMATANTWGLGATSDYVGRVKLDAAFLSRFPAKLSWSYDEEFEKKICGNPQWATRVQRARKRAFDAGLKVVIDPRTSICGAALLAAGFPQSEVEELTFLANLKPDQREMVLQ